MPGLNIDKGRPSGSGQVRPSGPVNDNRLQRGSKVPLSARPEFHNWDDLRDHLMKKAAFKAGVKIGAHVAPKFVPFANALSFALDAAELYRWLNKRSAGVNDDPASYIGYSQAGWVQNCSFPFEHCHPGANWTGFRYANFGASGVCLDQCNQALAGTPGPAITAGTLSHGIYRVFQIAPGVFQMDSLQFWSRPAGAPDPVIFAAHNGWYAYPGVGTPEGLPITQPFGVPKPPSIKPGLAPKPAPGELPSNQPRFNPARSPVPEAVPVPLPIPGVGPVVEVPPMVAPSPGAAPVPVTIPDIVVDVAPAAAPVVSSRGSTASHSRPPRTPQRKANLRVAGSTLMGALNLATEAGDLIDSLYAGVPKSYWKNGKPCANHSYDCKMAQLGAAWEDPEFDVAKALEAWINNQIEDTAYGMYGRLGNLKGAHPLAPQTGAQFRPGTGGRADARNPRLANGADNPLPSVRHNPDGSWGFDWDAFDFHWN